MTNVAKKPTGSVKTEVIVGQAASSLQKANMSIKEALSKLDTFDEEIEKRTAKLADLDFQLFEKQQSYDNTLKQGKIDLELAIKENKENVVNSILREMGQTAIANSELAGLKSEIEKLNTEMNNKISQAVGAAISSMKKDHENEKALTASKNEQEKANLIAQIEQAHFKIDFLTKQNEGLTQMIESERAASIERAKASQPVIQQTAPSGR